MLDTLSERVFTSQRVSLMLNDLLRHQRQAKTAENARLITLTKELERTTTGLDRLYQAIEEGAVSMARIALALSIGNCRRNAPALRAASTASLIPNGVSTC